MRVVLSALVALASLALPAVAHAATMDDFTVTGHGLDLTFSLPASPSVGDSYDKGFYFLLGDISFTENGTMMTASDVYFYTKPDEGGSLCSVRTASPSITWTSPVRSCLRVE